jgi:hypothetical protein
MGQRRPQRRRRKGQARPALLRRLGRLGAALALAVELLLPIIAMPPAALAAAGAATTPAEAILDQASAVWGSAALCEPGSSAPPHHGKQGPLLVHACPICWAVQQAASLLPPSLPPLPLASAPAWLKAAVPDDDLPLRRDLSPAQPRGPPLV